MIEQQSFLSKVFSYTVLPFIAELADNEIIKNLIEFFCENVSLNMHSIIWNFVENILSIIGYNEITSFIRILLYLIIFFITIIPVLLIWLIIFVVSISCFITYLAIFFAPIILLNNKSIKKSKKHIKFYIPIYNMYLLCKNTKTNFSLFIMVLLSSIFNPPIKNVIIYFTSEKIFINNDLFSIITLLIYSTLSIIFFTKLIINYYKNKITDNYEQNKIVIPNKSVTEKSPNPTLAVYKEQEKPVITEKPKKKCPNCGAGNGLEAKYCFICNTEFKDNK